jgi:hypothetical protein
VETFERSYSRRRCTLGTWTLAAVLAGGLACSRQPIDQAASGPEQVEAAFAQQAEAVREGASSQIRLDRTVVSDDDLRHLDGLESKLARLNLSQTQITDDGLARLCAMTRLEQFRLASPQITDEGLKSIARLEHLRFLHLIDMPITDAGLDELRGLKSLESLYLDGTKVTDEGLARVVKALPRVHLHIDDHHHRLDPHAAEHSHRHEK